MLEIIISGAFFIATMSALWYFFSYYYLLSKYDRLGRVVEDYVSANKALHTKINLLEFEKKNLQHEVNQCLCDDD